MTSHVLVEVAGTIPEPLLRAQSVAGKFVLMFFAIALFAAVVGLVLFLASLFKGRTGEKCQGVLFVGPAIAAARVRPDLPAILTIFQSFRRQDRRRLVRRLDNYEQIFTEPELLLVLRNTAIWVHPRARSSPPASGWSTRSSSTGPAVEAFAKALIFLPMAISFVGASIIWKFVYDYQQTSRPQIGLLNADPHVARLRDPAVPASTRRWNTFFLIVVMIWIQAGFAMTVLSAAIKAIPDDIVEAAQLDGVSALQDVPVHHAAEHPARPRRRAHDDRHRHAEGLRHRPDDDRRQLRHLGGRQRVLQPELPVRRPGPRRRARGAAVHPRHPDRRLQRPPAAQRRPER